LSFPLINSLVRSKSDLALSHCPIKNQATPRWNHPTAQNVSNLTARENDRMASGWFERAEWTRAMFRWILLDSAIDWNSWSAVGRCEVS
jgi:hypothetical protein